MATGENHFEDETVRLTELIGLIEPDKPPVLRGYTFERCQLHGPAIILLPESTVEFCNFGPYNLDGVFWEVPSRTVPMIGAMLLHRCVLRGCTFSHIGIAGPREVIDEFRASVVVPGDEPPPTSS